MPEIPTRRQQPKPVPPQVALPGEFPAIPQEIKDRFPGAADWERRLNDFWKRTDQAIQQVQQQTASQVNSTVIWTVDKFLIYTNNGGSLPMFALDDTGIRLGNVLVINTPGRKVYIGAGEYANDNTPFYIDVDGKFSLGANLTWDPDTATLTITGIINATSGTIGGFAIGADYIRDVANSFGLSSTVTGGDDIRFWAGDTFANRATAPLHISEAGILTARKINISDVAGTDNRFVTFQTTAVDRWRFALDSTAESGGDAGSNLFLAYYDDAGVYLGNALSFTRSTGILQFQEKRVEFRYQGIGATSTTSIVVYNPTTASSGNQQWSPRIELFGVGWKTDAGGASQGTGWITEVRPVQGAAAPTSLLVFASSINQPVITGTYTDRVHITSAGALRVLGLGGAGTRNVVVDANGVMSAP